MTNMPFAAVDDFRDIESLNHYAEAVGLLGQDEDTVLAGLRVMSRDNARTPVQWCERVVSHGSFELVLRHHPTVFAYTRTLGARQRLVIANLSGDPADYEVPDADAWSDAGPVLGNREGRPPRVNGSCEPWEAQVFLREIAD